MNDAWLREYLRRLQRHAPDEALLEPVGERVQRLNDSVLHTAGQHHPLPDPASYRTVLLGFLGRR